MQKIMEAREINTKLHELTPKAKELYYSVTNWQDGLDTGSTIVIEDVLMLYFNECLKKTKLTKYLIVLNFLNCSLIILMMNILIMY